MTIRNRKLVGTVCMFTLVIVWALLAMAFAQVLAISASPVWQFAYYAIAGIGWIFPAMPLISWMSKPDAKT